MYRRWRDGIVPLVALLAVASGLLFGGGRVSADEPVGKPSPIQVLDQSAESRFGSSMIFRVQARSTAGKITSARVVWRVRSFESVTSRNVPAFTPQDEVSLEYVHSTNLESTPPWQVIFYRWILYDEAGNRYSTPEVKAEYSDDTRDWQKQGDGKVAVYWYDRDATFGRDLMRVTRRAFDHIAAATGFTPDDELRVVVFNSQSDFCSFYAFRACQDWVGGQAFGSVTVGWLDEERASDNTPSCDAECRQRRRDNRIDWFFNNLVPHELAHAFLNYWMGPRVFAIPIWFNEGQAMNNELKGIDEATDRVRELAAVGRLERLALMEARGTIGGNDIRRVGDWYDQASSIVTFLYERWGDSSLGEIVTRVNGGMNFLAAMEEVTGLTLEEYELAWRQWLGVTEIPPTFVPTPTLFFPPTPTHEPTPRR